MRGITPSQTVGPFLKIGLERDELQYLVREDADGAIKILGHVYDGEGKPVPDAMIEIWQANIHGKYAHPDDSSEGAIIEGFSGFGRSCTDKDGKFFFVTVKISHRKQHRPPGLPARSANLVPHERSFVR